MKWFIALIVGCFVIPCAMAQNPLDNPNDRRQADAPGGVFDPDLMGQFFPEIAKMPAPDWIKPGTRLSYLSSVARLDGDGELVEHANGQILNPKTGKRYVLAPAAIESLGPKETIKPVIGGSALRSIDVSAMDGEVVALDQSAYAFDALNNSLMLANTLGVVTHSGFNQWWVNPAGLAELVKVGSDSFVAYPIRYTMDERTYNAVRIVSVGAGDGGSYTANTYDAASGVLLRGVEVAQNSGFNDVGVQFQGRRFLWISTLKTTRQMKLPWLDAPVPDWVNQIQGFEMQGNVAYFTPGQTQQPAQPMSAKGTIKSRGKGWLRYTFGVSEMGAAGVPIDGIYERSTGTGSLGGLWISPKVLQQMRPDQVIDEDPVTGVRSFVSFVGNAPDGRQAVMISQTSPKTRIDFAYDMDTGMLKRHVLSWDAEVARNVKTIDMVKTR